MASQVFMRHASPDRGPYAKRLLLIGLGAVVLLVVGVGLWGRHWLGQGTRAATVPLAKAYEMLELGQPLAAEALFKPLTRRADKGIQSQGYLGLAAVAFARSDYSQSLDYAGQAEVLDSEVVYSHVLRGHVLLFQGKTAAAAAAYRTASEKTHGFSWQHIVAHNRLGRIYAAAGNVPQALAHYDQALSLQPNGQQEKALAYANKGHLLAQQGKLQEALILYRQALHLNPHDPVMATLWREAERRAQFAQDQAKQERIEALVAELLQLHREGRPRPDHSDGWTSAPLTLAFLPMQVQGTLSVRAGEEDFLFLRLADALQATGRIVVVERDLLDKMLAELKLSHAELTGSQAPVRVGRILAARLLAMGSLIRFGAEAQLSLRVIETESTRLKAAVTEIIDLPMGMDNAVEQFVATLLQKLRTAYPLQGRIVEATPDDILLNIGTAQGVTPGLHLEVFAPGEPVRLEGKLLGYKQPHVGLVEVTSVQEQFAQARMVEQTVAFEPGWKVKEVQKP